MATTSKPEPMDIALDDFIIQKGIVHPMRNNNNNNGRRGGRNFRNFQGQGYGNRIGKRPGFNNNRNNNNFRQFGGGFRQGWNNYRQEQIFPQAKPGGGVMMTVGNLDPLVTESDIKDLFAEFGPMQSFNIIYDRNGRSTGVAQIRWQQSDSAMAAAGKYNNVSLDNRPMLISIEGSAPTIDSRLSGGFNNFNRNRGGFRGRNNGQRQPYNNNNNNNNNNFNNNRKPKTSNIVPTAAELDAELDNYQKGRIDK